MRLTSCVIAFLLALSGTLTAAQKTVFRTFIKAEGDQLIDGAKPFRFISFNIPNLHLAEDNMAFEVTNPWRLPDRFEIEDALETIRQSGGRVARTYVLSVTRTNDPNMPAYVLGPNKFNEEAFRTLDLVLAIANQKGVRLIIPFVDNWVWWGGRAEYAAFRGKAADDFWTDRQVIEDFKATINFVVNRTNTITRVPYREDKAILCWETGNELQSPAAWTREIASYVKSLDRNHLLMDGYHSTELREESLLIPEIDVVTTHHYPGGTKTYPQLVLENWAKAKGRKPYVVGEFGFVETAHIAETIEAVEKTGCSGALIWSLRVRNRDGGFYWHSEPAGGNKYKAYHWPGFGSGTEYDEIPVLQVLSARAHAIQQLAPPKPRKPEPPTLLPCPAPGQLRWQGCVGATSYAVERAQSSRGPWKTLATHVDESEVQYRPSFVDTTATPGTWYYRVRAVNPAGNSRPSNVIGPIKTTSMLFLDEMVDFSKVHAREGKLELQTRDSRKAKEDAHRVAGDLGSSVVYRVDARIEAWRIWSFFPEKDADFEFAVSQDGTEWRSAAAEKQVIASGAGDYGYWTPAIWSGRVPEGAAFTHLRIRWKANAQIGRLEISSVPRS